MKIVLKVPLRALNLLPLQKPSATPSCNTALVQDNTSERQISPGSNGVSLSKNMRRARASAQSGFLIKLLIPPISLSAWEMYLQWKYITVQWKRIIIISISIHWTLFFVVVFFYSFLQKSALKARIKCGQRCGQFKRELRKKVCARNKQEGLKQYFSRNEGNLCVKNRAKEN